MNTTAIIACKDRDENIKYCLQSINMCSPRPRCILVDFGSDFPLINYRNGFSWLTVIRVDRKTDLFHKTRAINIGIKRAKTPYVCLTDADQIFQPNFFGILEKTLITDPKSFVRCKTYFANRLPGFNPEEINRGHYKHFLRTVIANQTKKPHGEGCCHGVLRKWLLDVGGHDEKYIGWGYEDKDLVMRAKSNGYHMVWIDDKTSMVHLPHQRNKGYFCFKHISKNRTRFENKRKNVQVVANSRNRWGIS